VMKLKKAGAIIIGKTNMHQMGMGTTGLDSYFGPVHNPWNPDYIPGGSSSGSAAAVASGMCYATLDTDAIGSCRLPAACCGVVGFKGTYGLISTKGILEGEEADEMILWFSHAAITTRSVQDIAIVLDVLAEREPNEQIKTADFVRTLARNRKLRVGAANNFKADQEVKVAFENAVETIRSLGYPIISIPAPFGDPSGGIANIEADRKTIASEAFKDIDILLLPTTTTTVLTIEAAGTNPQALSPENTAFANYYGLPAISVLCGFDTNGLPLGLQIVGKPWDESAVLRLAYQYQASTKDSNKHPYE
jgi:aspartyl-tRNA(Asn)/glutamyl-tRNA(Gln) amidotransferase subunit A